MSFKVLLGMQAPSVRPNILTITEHSQIDRRNRRDKFRAAEDKDFPFLETIYCILKNRRGEKDRIDINKYLAISFESF